MFVENYQHPYELQRIETGADDYLAPNGRDGNGQREETNAPMRLYDEAGRIPYEDIC